VEGTELPGGDAIDDGNEHGGEERGDVENQQIFAKSPGEEQEYQDAEGEKDVAVDRALGGGFGGGRVVG
jgi:hypothetical protein